MTEKRNEPICRYSAASLNEVFDLIQTINSRDMIQNKDKKSILWFRALHFDHYSLVPSLFRDDSNFITPNANKTYSVNHLREDYRYQNFRARCSQLIDSAPEEKIEWQEIMQHHLVKTRLMDWSESLFVALHFAVEPFVDTNNDLLLNHKRSKLRPSVWVLDPNKLNSIVYDFFCEQATDGNYPHIMAATQEFFDIADSDDNKKFAAAIGDELKKNKKFYFSLRDNKHLNEFIIDGFICLSAIEAKRTANIGRLQQALKYYSFNPFFYLLARYYIDGIVTFAGGLPPLAIVHPYHSSRIQIQKGVFTIIPHYSMNDKQKQYLDMLSIDVRDLRYQSKISSCLTEIRLSNPARIARDLFEAGERNPSLYPDIERYGKVIETNTVYY